MIKSLSTFFPVAILSILLMVSGISLEVARAGDNRDHVLSDEIERFSKLKKKAEKGNASALHEMGLVYSSPVPGYGWYFDIPEAMKWFQRASDKHYAETEYLYGLLYAKGQWRKRAELPDVVSWLVGANEQDDEDTYFLVDTIYRGEAWANGQDSARAFMWFEKAARQKHTKAQLNLGAIYLAGIGTPKDTEKAIKWITRAAGGNDRVAQNVLAHMYHYGQGLPQEHVKAIKWYKKAGEQGLAEAQFVLGYIYSSGLIAARDDNQAFKWYKMVAEQDDAPKNLGVLSRITVARMYASGTGTPRNLPQAIKLYGPLAEQGIPDAMFELAEAHYGRSQGNQDSDEALKWYYLAAQKNHAGAQFMLGAVFDSSLIGLSHVPAEYQDEAYEDRDRLAMDWYTKSAQQCYPKAARQLGVHYTRGDGVPKDQVQAHKWFSIAVACGDKGGSQGSLGFLIEDMSPEQISQAEALAAEWLKAHGK